MATEQIPSEQTDPVRVLHVDDDPDVIDLVRAYLERYSDAVVVESAVSGHEGIARFEDEAYDCIVSDYSMPGIDGIEFLRQVRAQSSVPFILYTGQGSEEVASEAIRAGVTDYVQKGGPDRLALLQNRIDHAIENTRLQQELHAEAEKFRAVFERASDAMVLADREGRYVDVNPAACALFGASKAEMLGRTAADFAPADFDFEAAWERFSQSSRERGAFPLVRSDGTSIDVEYVATPNIVSGINLSILREVGTGEMQ